MKNVYRRIFIKNRQRFFVSSKQLTVFDLLVFESVLDPSVFRSVLILQFSVPRFPILQPSSSSLSPNSAAYSAASWDAYRIKPMHQECDRVSIIPLGWKQFVL